MTVATHEPTTVSVEIGGVELKFETGRLAKQASGAVWAQAGGTAVLGTATGATSAREGTDFFPLTVDVEEKMYAAGKIPGGFFKREGRAGERSILTARMIDRPIRPLWPKGYRNAVHCIATVLSADMTNNHDLLAINAISAALMVSPLPFFGPVSAVRVGLVDGDLTVNPTMPQMLESSLDLLVCGSPEAITMVECGAEIVSEDLLVEALDLAHQAIKKICAAQIELAEKAGKPKWTSLDIIADMRSRYMSRIEQAIQSDGIVAATDFVETTLVDDAAPAISMSSGEADIEQRIRAKATLGILLQEARVAALKKLVDDQFGSEVLDFSNAEQDSKELKAAKKADLVERVVEGLKLPFAGRDADGNLDGPTLSTLKDAFDAAYKSVVRRKIAVDKRRPDGRSEREIRAISCDVAITPRTHGSGLFTRGQTQILSICTLGTTKEEQRIDDLSLETNRYYMHHYNFPPFSVGETGFMRGPKRRDIGHGALAQRALMPVLPVLDDFPYTVRVVSETLESNGSSSMGSVCGSTMSLMDAGVPIKAPVAGIAMGLIKEGDDLVVLTDIQGAEDHLGDMDFKVAGTSEGVTALQMDIKITGVDTALLRRALDQAKDARLEILGHMREAIAEPRPEVNPNAPRIETVRVNPDQIGLVIGKGGETIRGLEEQYSVSIGIQEDGQIQIYGVDLESAKGAAEAIASMTKEISVGDEFDGTVVKTTEFGAFVELKKGTDGLLHISAMGPDRVGAVEDVCKRGDVLGVRVRELDPARGRISLVLIRDRDGKPVEVREQASGPRGGGDRGPRGGGGDRVSRGDRGPRGGGSRGSSDRGPRGDRPSGNRNRSGNRSGGGDGGNRERSDRPRGEHARSRSNGGSERTRDDRPRGQAGNDQRRTRTRRTSEEPRNGGDTGSESANKEGSGRGRFRLRLRGNSDND